MIPMQEGATPGWQAQWSVVEPASWKEGENKEISWVGLVSKIPAVFCLERFMVICRGKDGDGKKVFPSLEFIVINEFTNIYSKFDRKSGDTIGQGFECAR